MGDFGAAANLKSMARSIEKAAADNPSDLPERSPTQTINILLVAANAENRMWLMLSLRRAELDCRIVDTATIEEGLEACGKEIFDCAIINYPEKTHIAHGVMAIIKINRHTSVIVIATEGSDMLAADAMRQGAVDYIRQTEITANSLAACVNRSFQKSFHSRQAFQQVAELEAFAHLLVHDLLQPILSIEMFANTIENELSKISYSDPSIVELSRELTMAAKRSAKLVDAMHLLTKVDTESATSPVDMNEVLKSVLFDLAPQIKQRSVNVVFDKLPLVTGDESQLVQLIENLIGNAIKYNRSEAPTIEISAALTPPDHWQFTVRDNGIGIPPHEAERVFEPLIRLQGGSQWEGNGLGLAICRRIVSRHGGRIRCEANEEGEGAAFIFSLSASARAQARAEQSDRQIERDSRNATRAG
jgi:signal transduction histidine kinase